MTTTLWPTVFNNLSQKDIADFVNKKIGIRRLINTTNNQLTRAELYRLERLRNADNIRSLFKKAARRHNVQI